MPPFVRERLTLVLIFLLPFHAFAVTVLTKLIAGPGHAPLGVLALWKEALLGIILLIALFEIIKKLRATGYPSTTLRTGKLQADLLDSLIIALLLLSIVVSWINGTPLTSYLLGFKYDFVPLVAFLILRRVEWSEWFRRISRKGLMMVGGIVAVCGFLMFILPYDALAWLGYSDLHSLYVPGGPLAPFQQIGGTAVRRMQSVMSGPNQLGLWLLLPLSLYAVAMMRETRAVGVFGVLFASIVLTFSRSAWIASLVIVMATLWMQLPKKKFRYIASGAAVSLCVVLVLTAVLLPQIFLRVASSKDHLAKPLAAIHTMAEHPLGLGLGSAGPASNRTSDSCVFLEEGADTSWALAHPDLCVFVDGTQVQPERSCRCPFLTENWYLQIGVELGWIGMILFLVLVLMILRRLPRDATFLMFFGISIAALFLHAWEDSAVAYTAWLLSAIALTNRNLPRA